MLFNTRFCLTTFYARLIAFIQSNCISFFPSFVHSRFLMRSLNVIFCCLPSMFMTSSGAQVFVLRERIKPKLIVVSKELKIDSFAALLKKRFFFLFLFCVNKCESLGDAISVIYVGWVRDKSKQSKYFTTETP